LIAAALAIAAFGFHGAAGHAATITLDTKMTAGATPLQPVTVTFRLRLAGPIEDGDAEKLREILSKLSIPSGAKSDGSLTKIELSSLGGNLLEGFEIGSLLRKYKVIAVVRKQDICLSACALALLAGNAHSVPSVYPTECNVEIGAKVGFHNFSLNRNGLRDATSQDPVASRLQGFADARGGAAQLVKYAGEIGLPPSFVSSLIGRPVEDFLFIETAGQFISLRVCPIGINRPAIALAAQAINICSNSTGGPDPSAPLEATAIKPAQAKLYLLERVQENMKSSKAKGRLADQLSSGAVMRVKEEIDRLYDDLRAAGVALPDIVGPTFDIGRRRDGGYETVCYVSLSSDNPDNYDVVTQGPRGLSDPLRPPPENSRRLFLFNRDDVVNPRRR
jgi:hypothetical protein